MEIVGFLFTLALGLSLVASGVFYAFLSKGFTGTPGWFWLIPVGSGCFLIYTAIHFSPLHIVIR